MILPLHPVYRDFWRAEEKRLFALLQRETGMCQLMASIFYQAAAAQVRLLDERDKAIHLDFPLYVDRANQIARLVSGLFACAPVIDPSKTSQMLTHNHCLEQLRERLKDYL